MLRRSLTLLSILAVAVSLAPAALAVDVHVRVEGKTTTIFGTTQPLLAVPATALDALEAASQLGEFYYHVKSSSFGNYVDQIGRNPAAGSSGWVFKVNGVSPPVAADQVQLRNHDTVLWYWADFDANGGGPKTLLLSRLPHGCYQVWAQDDAGKRTQAAGALLNIGNRHYATRSGRGCFRGRHGLVRATLPGAVRSNALR